MRLKHLLLIRQQKKILKMQMQKFVNAIRKVIPSPGRKEQFLEDAEDVIS